MAFGILNIISIVLGMAFLGSMWGNGFDWSWTGFGFWAGIRSLVNLAGIVIWIVGMVKAYQHERFRIPIAADLADQLIGK